MPRPVAGLLLTGGSSRRLGRDKTRIEVDGVTLARRAARLLAEICAPVLEVGPGVSGLPSVWEVPPGGGPLAALVAGDAALRDEGVTGSLILLACDLPHVSASTLRALRDHPAPGTVVPEVAGALQYVCARYSRASLDTAAELFDSGGRSLRDLVATDAITRWAVPEPGQFADVDTPDDLRRLGWEEPR